MFSAGFKMIALSCILMYATGCNSEVFIDEFLPKIPSAVITNAGENAEIAFNAGNWDIMEIGWGAGGYVQTTLYGLDGQPLGTGLPFKNRQRARIDCRCDYADFQIIRRDDLSLEVILGENMYDFPMNIRIRVGNEYETEDIYVTLNPSARYAIDKVEWDFENYTFYNNTLIPVQELTIDNSAGTNPVTWTVCPYKDAFRKVRFWDEVSSTENDYSRWFGTLPEMTIPDIVDCKPVLKETKAVLTNEYQQIETGLPGDFTETVVIGAGQKNKVTVFLEEEYYNINYIIHASSPSSGRKRTFKGALASSNPFGHFIFKANVTDTE